MKHFYGHIARGEDKVSALANAKRDMMDRYKDISPYYWAPFVLVGEGAEKVFDDR
jgi:CHAT domain-containing protein